MTQWEFKGAHGSEGAINEEKNLTSERVNA